MMVGLPGSGKSTWVRQQADIESTFDNLTEFCYSTDNIITDLAEEYGMTYNQAFPMLIEFATKVNDEYLFTLLKKSDTYTIYWDQTNLTRNTRRKKLNRFPGHYEKHCVYFPVDTNNPDWYTRLNGRPDKTIPENVLNSMIATLEVPTLDEGFDSIININTFDGWDIK